MATTEERLKILKMVEDGKITAEDAAKLLAALNEGRKNAPPPAAGASGGEARWFRVRISELASGKTTTTVNIPLGLDGNSLPAATSRRSAQLPALLKRARRRGIAHSPRRRARSVTIETKRITSRSLSLSTSGRDAGTRRQLRREWRTRWVALLLPGALESRFPEMISDRTR